MHCLVLEQWNSSHTSMFWLKPSWHLQICSFISQYACWAQSNIPVQFWFNFRVSVIDRLVVPAGSSSSSAAKNIPHVIKIRFVIFDQNVNKRICTLWRCILYEKRILVLLHIEKKLPNFLADNRKIKCLIRRFSGSSFEIETKQFQIIKQFEALSTDGRWAIFFSGNFFLDMQG